MYLVGAGEMRDIETRALESYGITENILMENAGAAAVNAMLAEYGPLGGKRICVFCGTGNNGGDGFVIARHLLSEGAVPYIFITCNREKMSSASAGNLTAAIKYGVSVYELNTMEQLGAVHPICSSCDLIIDAIFGNGISRAIEGFASKLIIYINSLGKITISVDLPSGINPDTGNIMGTAVQADMTVTFGLPKLGLSVYPGYQHTGKLVLADINFPPQLLGIPRKNVLITANIASAMLPYRPGNANKGTFGPVLIIGGSPGLCGAVTLAGRAALKSGAGIVNACVPEGQYTAVKSASEEMLVTSLKENKNGSISEKNREHIKGLIDKSKTVLIGPGAGTDEETRSLIREIIAYCDKPMIIDADGINAVAQDKNCLNNAKKDVIMTPHMGEMSRLCSIPIEQLMKEKITAASEFAVKNGINVLLKDGRSFLSDKDGNIYVNTTGNNGLASPGTGDVLAGIISSLKAQGTETAAAGIAGSYIHGLAADMLLKDMSEEGITASDVIVKIPSALKKIRKQED